MPPPGLKLRVDKQAVAVGTGLSVQRGGANGSAIYLIAGEADAGRNKYHVQMSLVGRKRLDEGFAKGDLTAAGAQISVTKADGLYLWIPDSQEASQGLQGLTLLSTRNRLTAVWQGRLKPAQAGTVATEPVPVDVGINVAFSEITDPALGIKSLRWFAGQGFWPGP
jgi:hypothetical protein